MGWKNYHDADEFGWCVCLCTRSLWWWHRQEHERSNNYTACERLKMLIRLNWNVHFTYTLAFRIQIARIAIDWYNFFQNEIIRFVLSGSRLNKSDWSYKPQRNREGRRNKSNLWVRKFHVRAQFDHLFLIEKDLKMVISITMQRCRRHLSGNHEQYRTEHRSFMFLHIKR